MFSVSKKARDLGAFVEQSECVCDFSISDLPPRRDNYYTPGVPSFSGVSSSFIPRGTLCACEPACNLSILTGASLSWKLRASAGS
jgi:hypothetical protein